MLRNNPIFDIENWREIFATLGRNKTRTLLTAFGIFWGTAMLAMLWGGSHGLEGMIKRNFEGFATNMGAIAPSRTSVAYRGFNKGLSWNMTTDDVDNLLRTASCIEYSTPVCNTYATISNGQTSTSGSVMGYEIDFDKINTPILYSGRLLNPGDISESRKVAIVGKQVAESLFGNDDPLGKYIQVNGVYFKVIGVIGQLSQATITASYDQSIIIPESTFRRAFNYGNRIDFFIYTTAAGYSPKNIEPYARRVISANHPVSPDDKQAIWLMDISENFEMVDKLFWGVSMLALIVGAGALMAGIIGVGNIMWIIVKERTQEIGIRRAIGAKPRDIIAQILSEGVVLTAIAGMAGVVFATLVLALADIITSDGIHSSAGFGLTIGQALSIVVVFLVLGTAAGTIPAVKAMHIKPIEAMRDK